MTCMKNSEDVAPLGACATQIVFFFLPGVGRRHETSHGHQSAKPLPEVPPSRVFLMHQSPIEQISCPFE